jgi:regulator of RNase E activity RraA
MSATFDPAPSEALPAGVVAQLQRVSTATLTSVLLRLGLRNTFMTDVHPLAAHGSPAAGTRLVGQAYTLRYIPMREDLDRDALEGRFDNLTNPQRIAVEHVCPGDVLVIDARGEIRAGSIGNILVTRMKQRGAAGLVTDGAFRDSAAIAAVGLPAYCRGAHAATNVTLHHPVDAQVPIACGGVSVFPGDAIVGDARAVEQEQREHFLLSKVQAGASIVGVYPPNEETLAEFERWRGQQRAQAPP